MARAIRVKNVVAAMRQARPPLSAEAESGGMAAGRWIDKFDEALGAFDENKGRVAVFMSKTEIREVIRAAENVLLGRSRVNRLHGVRVAFRGLDALRAGLDA